MATDRATCPPPVLLLLGAVAVLLSHYILDVASQIPDPEVGERVALLAALHGEYPHSQQAQPSV